jgi:hypothetical protein
VDKSKTGLIVNSADSRLCTHILLDFIHRLKVSLPQRFGSCFYFQFQLIAGRTDAYSAGTPGRVSRNFELLVQGGHLKMEIKPISETS